MSGQGKSLQDIYDAGSKRLDELEQKQNNGMSEASEKTAGELKEIEQNILRKMDDSLNELESEIRTYLDKATENIKSTVDTELDENKKFVERLQEALRLSCRSLSEDVKQLKETVTRRFESSADHYITLQERELEKWLGQLNTDGALSAAKLKELSQTGITSFSSRRASNVLQTLDKNIKVPAEFFAEFSRHAISIDKRINDCLQLLSSRSHEIVADLNTSGKDVESKLDQFVLQLGTDIEEIYKASDARLSKHCEEALSAALLYQEQLAVKQANELQQSSQSSGSGMSEKLNTLKTDTNTLLEQVKQFLADVDTGVRQNCLGLSESFEESLTNRIAAAREHNKLVGEERGKLMETIGKELREIENNFESRLKNLADSCQSKLSQVCSDAEMAIVSAHDSCAAEFKTLASSQQRAIEEKTLQILGEIEKLSNEAVKSIKEAAGDNGNASKSDPTAKSAEIEIQQAGQDLFGNFGDLKL